MLPKKKTKKDQKPAWWKTMSARPSVEQAPEVMPQAEAKAKLNAHESLERIQLVSDRLTERYKNYEQTKAFIGFLASTEEIFSRAMLEKWNPEKTQKELIESEIYLMSVASGIDEKVFRVIYADFQELSQRAHTVQVIAKQLIEKYEDCEPCIEFIRYVRDFILIFSHHRSEPYTLPAHKDEVIRARMKVISSRGTPPLHVLEDIYEEFGKLMVKE